MKILFHHLQKTAGTSLISQLKKVYRNHFVNARYDNELTDEVLRAEQTVFYHGHYTLDAVTRAQALLGRGVYVFTFLRHPLARTVSQYFNWVDRERIHASHRHLVNRGHASEEQLGQIDLFEREVFQMSLSDFIRSDLPLVREVVEDYQTRQLSPGGLYDRDPDRAMDGAVHHLLSACDFFGITELYDQSLVRLLDGIGVDYGLVDREFRKNTNEQSKVRSRYRVSQGDYDLLVARNQRDLRLYDIALGAFLARYQMGTRSILDTVLENSVVIGDPPTQTAAP